MVARDVAAGTITYIDPDTNERIETPVTGGRVKCQWKADWAMRWVALGIDYEMAGKDLIDSVRLSSEICRALGRAPPESYIYELFLDEKGQKISKSKGNGLTIDEWLRYAGPRACRSSCTASPRPPSASTSTSSRARSTSTSNCSRAISARICKQRLSNAVWHVHSGEPPVSEMPVTFSMLLTLVSSSNAENAETLWGFIGRYRPGVTPQTHPRLDALVGYAIHYYRDFVLPAKTYREPTRGRAGGARTICATRSAHCPPTPPPSKSRTWSTRSVGASRSST